VAGLLIVTATGPQDPTRASIAFHIAANGGGPAGVDCGVAFAGDAAELMKPDVIAAVKGVGIPPLRELMEKCRAQNVHFYV
jgi:predicted peroxiredoxin